MGNLRKEGSFNRPPIHIISWFLFTLGINVSKKEKFSGEIIRLMAVTLFPQFSGIISISMYAYMNRHDFNEMIKVAAYLSTCIILIITLLHLFANKTQIRTLISKLDENVYRYPDEDDIKVKFVGIFRDENSHKITNMVLYYACFGFILAAVSPLVGFMITGIYTTSIFPSWFPWSQEKPLLQSFTLIFQGYICFVVFWTCYTLELLLIFLVVEFLKQYQRLCVALSTMHLRTKKRLLPKPRNNDIAVSSKGNPRQARSDNICRRETYDKIYREKIVHCIKHHQEIQRLFKLFKPWFLVFFTTELFFSAITFALSFYNLLVLSSSSDTTYSLTIVGSTINIITLLFCRCFIGEMFFDMNGTVSNTIFYEVGWNEQSKPNKQLLILFHILAKRPNSLVAFSIFPASYYTFVGLLRLSYSYFNLLKTTLGKDRGVV